MESRLVPLAEEVNKIARENITQKEIDSLRNSLLTMIENLGSKEKIPVKSQNNTTK